MMHCSRSSTAAPKKGLGEKSKRREQRRAEAEQAKTWVRE